MNKNVNYGNWVPEKMLALCYVAAAVLGIAAYVTGPDVYKRQDMHNCFC